MFSEPKDGLSQFGWTQLIHVSTSYQLHHLPFPNPCFNIQASQLPSFPTRSHDHKFVLVLATLISKLKQLLFTKATLMTSLIITNTFSIFSYIYFLSSKLGKELKSSSHQRACQNWAVHQLMKVM